jgi:hypothetical protein
MFDQTDDLHHELADKDAEIAALSERVVDLLLSLSQHDRLSVLEVALVPVRFDLGQIVITRGVHDQCKPEQVMRYLERHATGDWGELDPEDRQANESALRGGYRLLSSYGKGDDRVWVITEADRSVTTVLLPEEY